MKVNKDNIITYLAIGVHVSCLRGCLAPHANCQITALEKGCPVCVQLIIIVDTDMLVKLNWPSLQQRKNQDMGLTYAPNISMPRT